MLYMPLRYELDTTELVMRAWQSNMTVCVPWVNYDQKRMLPMEIRSLNEPMDADRHGVRTPRAGAPVPVEILDMVIVPGLGFDREGRRIGRGGGFYDRFLSQRDFHGTTCGIALHEQIIDDVPVVSHDIPLHMLVTDRDTLRFEMTQRSGAS